MRREVSEDWHGPRRLLMQRESTSNLFNQAQQAKRWIQSGRYGVVCRAKNHSGRWPTNALLISNSAILDAGIRQNTDTGALGETLG